MHHVSRKCASKYFRFKTKFHCSLSLSLSLLTLTFGAKLFRLHKNNAKANFNRNEICEK